MSPDELASYERSKLEITMSVQTQKDSQLELFDDVTRSTVHRSDFPEKVEKTIIPEREIIDETLVDIQRSVVYVNLS
jgi:hypothetical protein